MGKLDHIAEGRAQGLAFALKICKEAQKDGADPVTALEKEMIEGESRVKAFKDMQALINARNGPVAADIVFVGLLEQIAGSLAVIADALAAQKDGEQNETD